MDKPPSSPFSQSTTTPIKSTTSNLGNDNQNNYLFSQIQGKMKNPVSRQKIFSSISYAGNYSTGLPQSDFINLEKDKRSTSFQTPIINTQPNAPSTSGSFMLTQNGQEANKLQEINKIQANKIKELNRMVLSYKESLQSQNEKLIGRDELEMDYNSLKKNIIELNKLLSQYKLENYQLKILNQRQSEMNQGYAQVIKESTEKFAKYEEANNTLQRENEELNTKLKNKIEELKNYTDLHYKYKEIQKQNEDLTNENAKIEEIFKIKASNIEKSKKVSIQNLEDEISDLKLKNEKLKLENDKARTLLNEAQNDLKTKDNLIQQNNRNNEKEKENYNKTLLRVQNENEENSTNQKETIDLLQRKIENLKNEITKLSDENETKQKENQDLLNQLKEADKSIKDAQKELNKRQLIINSLSNENESLKGMMNEKQIEVVEFQKSTQNEINILSNKLQISEEEKEKLINEIQMHETEKSSLQEKLNINENDRFVNGEEVEAVRQKYAELVDAFNAREEQFNNQIEEYNSVLAQKESNEEMLTNKYETALHKLKIENNSYKARIKNLMTTLTSLKDYAISVDRNMSEINDQSYINNLNNSGLNSFNGYVSFPEDQSLDYSRGLIKGMKDLLNKIDNKMIKED